MDFTLSEEQQALVNVTRQFAQRELANYGDKIEKTGSPAPRILLQRFAEMGFLGVNLPTHYGGGGMSHLDAVLAATSSHASNMLSTLRRAVNPKS